MINTLYSLLMAGSTDISDVNVFRKRNPDIIKLEHVIGDKNPYTRNAYASGIIEMAKRSHLYPYIQDMDKSNTYDNQMDAFKEDIQCVGGTVEHMSDTCPYIDAVLDRIDNYWVAVLYGGNSTEYPDVDDNSCIHLHGMVIKPQEGVNRITVKASKPVSSISIPDAKQVKRITYGLSKSIKDLIDYDNPYDRSAAFCIALLWSYYAKV